MRRRILIISRRPKPGIISSFYINQYVDGLTILGKGSKYVRSSDVIWFKDVLTEYYYYYYYYYVQVSSLMPSKSITILLEVEHLKSLKESPAAREMIPSRIAAHSRRDWREQARRLHRAQLRRWAAVTDCSDLSSPRSYYYYSYCY